MYCFVFHSQHKYRLKSISNQRGNRCLLKAQCFISLLLTSTDAPDDRKLHCKLLKVCHHSFSFNVSFTGNDMILFKLSYTFRKKRFIVSSTPAGDGIQSMAETQKINETLLESGSFSFLSFSA